MEWFEKHGMWVFSRGFGTLWVLFIASLFSNQGLLLLNKASDFSVMIGLTFISGVALAGYFYGKFMINDYNKHFNKKENV